MTRDELLAMDSKQRLAYGRKIIDLHNDPLVKNRREYLKYYLQQSVTKRKRKQDAKELAEKIEKEKKEKHDAKS